MMEDMSTFLGKPFSADMSALDWFLFLGLILVFMIMWRIILSHIAETLK